MNSDNKDIRDICSQIADVYKHNMLKAGYNQQGELMNFKWTTEFNGTMFELYFILPDYFPFAENGRRPGKFPPPEEILKWIRFKQMVPRAINGKVPTTNQLVYLISRKIAQKGTEGKHLLQKTINETYNTLVDKLVDLITIEFEKEIEKDIENVTE